MSKYKELRTIDVSAEIRKKGKFNYLPWSYAVDTLLLHDPAAVWSYGDAMEINGTFMVNCSVTAFGKTMTEYLPVIDGANKAITNPNAMQVNSAMKRCLVKAIALHGIGLSLYAGDEFWDEPEESPTDKIIAQLENCKTADELKTVFGLAWAELKTKKQKEQIQPIYEKKKAELNATSPRTAG
jgi:Protein of unknown function (DUF1071)